MLEISNITKIFNKEEGIEYQKKALDCVNLVVEDGDFVSVIGGNGSGKSTLMNIISGVYKPDSGYIKIDGEDMKSAIKLVLSILRDKVGVEGIDEYINALGIKNKNTGGAIEAYIYKKFIDLDGIKIENVLLPKELIVKDGKLYGYTMDYFNNSVQWVLELVHRFYR